MKPGGRLLPITVLAQPSDYPNYTAPPRSMLSSNAIYSQYHFKDKTHWLYYYDTTGKTWNTTDILLLLLLCFLFIVCFVLFLRSYMYTKGLCYFEVSCIERPILTDTIVYLLELIHFKGGGGRISKMTKFAPLIYCFQMRYNESHVHIKIGNSPTAWEEC